MQKDYKPSAGAGTHPITPPPELVSDWAHMLAMDTDTYVFTQAARWGADQELEACVEWVSQWCPRWPDGTKSEDELRAARRPKPPSFKELALETLKYPKDLWSEAEVDTIRRALEQLDD